MSIPSAEYASSHSRLLAVPPSLNPLPDSVATLNRKWLPWLRAVWILVALNALAVFGWLLYLTYQFAQDPPPRIAAGLDGLAWSHDLYFTYHAALMTLDMICYFVVGALIFILRPNERMAFFASIFLIAFGAENAYPFSPEFAAGWETTSLLFRAPYFLNNIFAWSFIAAFLALFPDGRFVPKWSRYVALYVFFFSFLFGLFPSRFGAPEGWLLVVVLVSALVIFGGSLYAQVWRYRHYATPLQKQQTKWLIYALAVIVIIVLGFSVAVYLLFPLSGVTRVTSTATDLAYFAANFSFVLLPLSIGIAIVRYRLWDIDLLIRRTLTYTIVIVLLAAVYFGLVILLQQLFASVTGQRAEAVTVLSTLAIAALFIPLRNRVQSVIDRRFYRKKYNAQQILEDFAQTVRDETNLDNLTGHLLQVVSETMQPRQVGLWLTRDPQRRERG